MYIMARKKSEMKSKEMETIVFLEVEVMVGVVVETPEVMVLGISTNGRRGFNTHMLCAETLLHSCKCCADTVVLTACC